MQASDIPALKFPIAFASAAGGAYVRNIPEASQIGINDGWASLETGFPPLTMDPVGTPPFGQDFNGILRQLSQWARWLNAGGQVGYDAAFAAAIAGYPKGALLRSADSTFFWISTADDNATDPDAGGAGWLPLLTLTNTPQGRLTLATNTPVPNTDQANKSLIFYTADKGNLLPVRMFGALRNYPFAADLQLQLTAAAAASTIVDVFAILDAGAPVLVFSPAWQVSTAGSGSRGTGAGFPELARFQGLLVNASAITCLNGAASHNLGAGDGVYLGSILIDSTPGQTSCFVTEVANSKWGVWNAYNRDTILLKGTVSATPFMGLAEEAVANQAQASVTQTFSQSQVSSSSIRIQQNGATIGSPMSGVGQFDVFSVTGSLTVQIGFPLMVAVGIPGFLGSNVITNLPAVAGGAGSGITFAKISSIYRG